MSHRGANLSTSVSATRAQRGWGNAMTFFWKRRQQERYHVEKEAHYDMDEAITTISARLRFLEALTVDLVAELPPTKRDRLLQHLEEIVSDLRVLPPPMYVPPGKEQQFYGVLRSAVQVLIEKIGHKVKRQ
jgi:hypothetical protein